ncbi:MAG: hypothetical protein K2N38_04225 [Oscillospiraceae bacterium]|nr:hypothetical protein [Oscillospiraceae bacterium]
MLSDRIIILGDNIKPKEARFTEFFNRKAVRLTISGIAAAAFTFLSGYYCVEVNYYTIGKWVLGGLIFFVMFTALGSFFANVGKGGIKKYAAANITAAAVFILTMHVWEMFCNLDLEVVHERFLSLYLYGLGENLLLFGIPAALSITLGFFALRGKTQQSK